MKVADIMTRQVEIALPDEPIQSVARRMDEGDFGFMPVCDGLKLQGTITDRDLAVRALARGLPGETPVSQVMTRDVTWCRADQDAKDVLELMAERAVRRLPIIDEEDRLAGVVSLGDLSQEVRSKHLGRALDEISSSPPTS